MVIISAHSCRDTMAEICEHPQRQRGLVLQLVPKSYTVLAGPPSFETCTRDVFPETQKFSWCVIQKILTSVAAAALHLHEHGILHGDLYGHNTLVDQTGHGLLGDFGAATIYGVGHDFGFLLERLEARAFGYMIDDLLCRCDLNTSTPNSIEAAENLRRNCLLPNVHERPNFKQILNFLRTI
jgi:serine/threonine protein kinase